MSDTSTLALDPRRLSAFRQLLVREPRTRLDKATLWARFATAFPARPQGPEERAWFAVAMTTLAAEGVLVLPVASGSGWDRSQLPPVPTFARLRREAPATRDQAWKDLPWHPALAWVPTCRSLPEDHVTFLRRVHKGLREGRFGEPVPFKHRSLELTGDEKRLAELARGALFGPGRLSLAQIGCLPNVLPLATVTVGVSGAVLVVENAEPFEMARRILEALPTPPYGRVAFGDGGRIEASLARLGEHPRAEIIHYVGDLDRPGLRIAAAAARVAREAGLPAVEPAPGIHAAMLTSARHLGAPDGWPAGDDAVGERGTEDTQVAWLPPDVQAPVRTMLLAGRRIPEEVLGPAALRNIWGAA